MREKWATIVVIGAVGLGLLVYLVVFSVRVSQVAVHSPQDLPDASSMVSIEEPYVKVMIITPSEYIGTVMELVQGKRGEMGEMTYLSPERVELHYLMPLSEIVFDFFDALKSRTRGYASLDYEPSEYRPSELVRVDILLNNQSVDAFSTIVHKDKFPGLP